MVYWISLLFISSSVAFGLEKERLKAPNGLSFADIKGYETWQVVAPSYRPDKKEVRYILGNDTLINAYKSGVPENKKPFPDGSILVKISYSEKQHPAFAAALVPDILQRIEFMVRDEKRFKETGGWGYARFIYEAKTGAFKPYGNNASFANECYQCHTLVKESDYVFTKYPTR
ncbi:MAG: cytochrome P460 family protein [Deltaproteobacteria bacterium]|nr:cytochrome P460 family protein [Deltaproteobacteria bacterium]